MFREIKRMERMSEKDRERTRLEREHDRLVFNLADCRIGTPESERARKDLDEFERMHPEMGF